MKNPHKTSRQRRVPRLRTDDYSHEAVALRRAWAAEEYGSLLEHVTSYSFDPHVAAGNIEHFSGVAQIPLGLAGPLLMDGEYATGKYVVPLATTEGTLVASYNRGMKVLSLCGGARTTVSDDAMQRSPGFGFDDARAARDFVQWIQLNTPEIAEVAESTTSVGKLKLIDPYLSNKFAFLRFNYTTGDAAGQNMAGRATDAACEWIRRHYTNHPIRHYYLEANFSTDKKASVMNTLHTRGKRVTAEATIDRDILAAYTKVTPEAMVYHNQMANIANMMAGANNNGLHSVNGLTALFIATGQDVANIAESSSALLHSEVTPEGHFYISITLPSMIVATHGGGTGLPTQSECLGLLDCKGKGSVMKFAEIAAGVTLAGEISLAAAISASDWVSSHEQYGRNR